MPGRCLTLRMFGTKDSVDHEKGVIVSEFYFLIKQHFFREFLKTCKNWYENSFREPGVRKQYKEASDTQLQNICTTRNRKISSAVFV